MKEKCQKKKCFKSENGREQSPLTPFCYSTLLLNFLFLNFLLDILVLLKSMP